MGREILFGTPTDSMESNALQSIYCGLLELSPSHTTTKATTAEATATTAAETAGTVVAE
jgi:hypothetical protein